MEQIREKPRWQPVRATLIVAGGLVLVVLVWLIAPSENFGVIKAGKAYRSAQPGSNLDQLLSRYKPLTILNLRGGTDADSWYRAEVEATRREAITFYDLPLSATRRPTRRELRVLIDTLRTCPLPILIHCKSGADRTGLASALFLMVREGIPPENALAEFSIRYGHIPLYGPERLHEPLDEYGAWLRTNNLSHSPSRLREWVRRDYRADDPHSEWPVLIPGPRVRAARDDTVRR